MKPPRTTGRSTVPWPQRVKPRDWLDLVVGVLMLVAAFVGVVWLHMPWWLVVSLSLGYVLLVGGVFVRVRNR
ncbi:MAG TPA: hypothetical protein VGU71_16580 [Candidatus Dormibacteraeota bacterium]|nr:hypothetical protein [Candidatus Dormibacteraeota bacterium]